MLDELKKRMRGEYTADNVRELERMEELFRLKRFNSGDALRLGNQIVREAEKRGGGLMVRIIRTEDNLPVFQYVDDTKSQRNVDFAMMKGNAVRATGHCSLWALVKELTGGNVPSVFYEGSECLPVGGAFPVYVGDRMAAIIETSGLRDGLDHLVVTEAMSCVQNAEVPAFTGKLV